MAIGKIAPISSTTPTSAVSSVTNASKTLQNQLQMKQQTLKKLSTDSTLSIDEKEKQRQELEKEIEALKRRIEQMRLKQEDEKKTAEAEEKKEIELEKASEAKTEKEENNETAVNKAEEHKQETQEFTAKDAQKILDTNLYLKEEMVQQGVEYDQQNTVRILDSQIKQDELRGTDTTLKEEQIEDIQKREKFWIDNKNKENEQKQKALISPDMQVVIN